MLLKTIDAYRMNIRNAARGLWSGEWDYFAFYDQMMLSIERGFTQAWYEGAKQYGILPSELSEGEHEALRIEVSKEISFINGLGTFVEGHNRQSGGKLSAIYARAELWVSGYNRVRVLGATYAAKDQKLEYVKGDTLISCADCKKYAGRVYRASTWRKHKIAPKMWELACHGVNCLCQFLPTDKPCTPGFPPKPSGG